MPLENLSLLGTATSQGTNNGVDDPAPALLPDNPTYINDDDTGTQSHKAGGIVGAATYGSHWMLDLGTARTVHYAECAQTGSATRLMQLEYSDTGDPGSWVDAGLGIDAANWVETPGVELTTYTLPTPITARHWRASIWFVSGGTNYYDESFVGELRLFGASPGSDCDSPLLFDVYSLGDATTPGLTYLVTLCDAFDKSFRVELDGTGSGKFSINRSSTDATEAILGNGDGDVRYIQVRIPDIDADPIFGFFIESGDFRLLDSDEEGGENLTFEGHGSLAYLDFAKMAAHSYLTTPFIGDDPFGGLWRLYVAGTGSKPGQILARIIAETQEAGRPSAPLPLLTYAFDYTDDSDSNTWASSTATDEFAAQIGESVLSVAGRLIGTQAITLQMSPDFVLGAYNSFGTDRNNATFAAGKVRFVGATNIAEGLSRQVRPTRVATHAIVYGEAESSAVAALADAASRVTREAYLSSIGSDATTLEAVGDAELAERQLRSESLSVRIALGDDEATGLYLPGPSGTNGHFWVGDTVTLHTGSADFDYSNEPFRVAAINVIEHPATVLVADLEVVVELGSVTIIDDTSGSSMTILSSSPGGGSSSVPPHTHPSDLSGALRNRFGGLDVVFAHGNMGATKTIDPTDGNVQYGTLNADCVATIASAPTTRSGSPSASTIELWVTQDGTGGWDLTFAATGGTFVWNGATPTLPTTAGETFRIILERVPGTTNDWVGDLVGGGGTPVSALDDLSDVAITSPVDLQRLHYNATAGLWENTSAIWRPLMDGAGNVLTDGGTGEALMALN